MDKIKFNEYDSGDQYQPTDSEEEYSEEEKELLKQARQGKERDEDEQQELLPFDDSDDDEDDDDDDGDANDVAELMEDSDIEGAGADDDADIPDSKAWGKKMRDYYNTDFVDPDYSSYTQQQEELAEQEEEEALAIQSRLTKLMDNAVFESRIAKSPKKPAKKSAVDDISVAGSASKKTNAKKIKAKVSKQLLAEQFAQDSPEFQGLADDLLNGLEDVNTLLDPVLNYAAKHKLPRTPALEFAQLMRNLLSSYCSNINFYLLLKGSRTPTNTHPVWKRLAQFRNLLGQLTERYEDFVKPQLEMLLERIEEGDEFELIAEEATAKPKAAALRAKNKRAKKAVGAAADLETDEEYIAEDEQAAIAAADDAEPMDERRAITYQIAKNRGLTPHRKKELRNPRVKNRTKFRKALIRRKGAVRAVRTETRRYDGEMSGIKATVSKSVKFK